MQMLSLDEHRAARIAPDESETVRFAQPGDPLEHIRGLIANPPETSVVMIITPRIAEAILQQCNTHNRNKKSGKIREYSTDIENGKWAVTGDTIKFSSTGRLVDGQNRLFACVRARRSIKTHVVFGLSDDVFPWIDKGKARTVGDDFFVEGARYPTYLANTLRWILLFDLNRVKERTTFSREQIRTAYSDRYDHQLLATALDKGRAVQKADGTPRSVSAALYYELASRNRELADEFFGHWTMGSHAGRMAPIAKARYTITKIHRTNPMARIQDTVRAAIWVTAWNHVVKQTKGTMDDFAWTVLRDFPAILG